MLLCVRIGMQTWCHIPTTPSVRDQDTGRSFVIYTSIFRIWPRQAELQTNLSDTSIPPIFLFSSMKYLRRPVMGGAISSRMCLMDGVCNSTYLHGAPVGVMLWAGCSEN
jgi:hypothetical protein